MKKVGLKPGTKYIFIWFVLAIAIAGFLGTLNWRESRNLESMISRDVAGEGTVLELLPENHATVRYEYQVAGRKFEGKEQSRKPNPPCERLEVGEKVVVYYDRQHPEDSILGDPTVILNYEYYNSDWIGIVLPAIAFPTLIVARWAWWLSRRRRKEGLSIM